MKVSRSKVVTCPVQHWRRHPYNGWGHNWLAPCQRCCLLPDCMYMCEIFALTLQFQHFCSNILGVKQEFSFLGAKQDFFWDILDVYTRLLFKPFGCKARLFIKHFGCKARLCFKPCWCKAKLLFKKFGCKERLLFKHIGCKARCLFKGFWCKASLLFTHTFVVQSKTFVQTFWVQSKTFVQTFWVQSKTFV